MAEPVNTHRLGRLLLIAPLKGASSTAGSINKAANKCHAESRCDWPASAIRNNTKMRRALSAIIRKTWDNHRLAKRAREMAVEFTCFFLVQKTISCLQSTCLYG